MPELQLAVIDVKPGAALESQSGVMHPASNFMGHYLLRPLAARGITCLGLNSRYAGNDTLLLMERVIQDLGAGVQHLRAQGYDKSEEVRPL